MPQKEVSIVVNGKEIKTSVYVADSDLPLYDNDMTCKNAWPLVRFTNVDGLLRKIAESLLTEDDRKLFKAKDPYDNDAGDPVVKFVPR